jgi:hypothetical protein
MAIGTTIDKAYYEVVNAIFWKKLGQRGSYLLPFVPQVGIIGSSEEIRSTEVGEPTWLETPTQPTKYTNQTYTNRKLEPKDFSLAIIRGQPEVRKVATLDPAILVDMMWDKCGAFLDRLILYGKEGRGGIGGTALVASDSETGYDAIALPDSQYIMYNDTDYGVTTDLRENTDEKITYGLSTAKLLKGVEKLRENYASDNIICISNVHAKTSLIADPRAANLQWNVMPTMAVNGIVSYAGVQNFIASEQVKKNIPSKVGDETIVDYAYLFAQDQIQLGVGAQLDFVIENSIDYSMAQVIYMYGAYDCIRMDENAVVCIEVKR